MVTWDVYNWDDTLFFLWMVDINCLWVNSCCKDGLTYFLSFQGLLSHNDRPLSIDRSLSVNTTVNPISNRSCTSNYTLTTQITRTGSMDMIQKRMHLTNVKITKKFLISGLNLFGQGSNKAMVFVWFFFTSALGKSLLKNPFSGYYLNGKWFITSIPCVWVHCIEMRAPFKTRKICFHISYCNLCQFR